MVRVVARVHGVVGRFRLDRISNDHPGAPTEQPHQMAHNCGAMAGVAWGGGIAPYLFKIGTQ